MLPDREKVGGEDLDCYVKELRDSDAKELAIWLCDDAFTLSVTNRPDYPELFRKIDEKAIMLATYRVDDFELCGYAAFYANDTESRQAYITLFCVRKELQRKYIGSLLMCSVINMAREAGMERIALEVLKQDTGAAAFYRKMGFRDEADRGEFIRMKREI